MESKPKMTRTAARAFANRFSIMTKDLPIKLSSIVKLEVDGSNFTTWERNLRNYLALIPDVADYFEEDMITGNENYKPEFAEVVNSILYWTMEDELSTMVNSIQHPSGRMAELRKQFSKVSFAGRCAKMVELNDLKYDSSTGSLENHLIVLRKKKEELKMIGLDLSDEMFAIVIRNSMPSDFPNVDAAFEDRIALNPTVVITSSDVQKAINAADIQYRRGKVPEALKLTTRIPPSHEQRTQSASTSSNSYRPIRCYNCNGLNHMARQCTRRRQFQSRGKSSNSGSVKTNEIELGMAELDLQPWDDPKDVTQKTS